MYIIFMTMRKVEEKKKIIRYRIFIRIIFFFPPQIKDFPLLYDQNPLNISFVEKNFIHTQLYDKRDCKLIHLLNFSSLFFYTYTVHVYKLMNFFFVLKCTSLINSYFKLKKKKKNTVYK